MDGKHVITIEGIGNVKRPHPAQERIAKDNGSQCGFCTPGIVMVRNLLYGLGFGTDDAYTEPLRSPPKQFRSNGT